MLSYLRLLKANYRTWREVKKLKKPLWRNMIASTIYLKYPPEHSFEGRSVLNFGAGGATYASPNVVNTDCTPGDHILVIPAEELRLPFEDNTFDLVIANHVLEHLPHWFETMQEFARVVKAGGVIEVWFPPVSSDSAFTYRDHVNRLGQESFSGILGISRPGSNLLASKEFTDRAHFAKLEMREKFYRPIVTWWTMLAPTWLMTWMATHLRNVISEEGYKFVKVAP